MATVPPTSSTAEALSASWECTDSRSARRRSDATSRMVKKPMPPRITSNDTVSSTRGSSAAPARLSENSENPALLNADTEWKTPSQAPRARPWVPAHQVPSTSAPVTSMTAVTLNTPRANRTTSPGPNAFRPSTRVCRSCRVIRRPRATPTSVEKVM